MASRSTVIVLGAAIALAVFLLLLFVISRQPTSEPQATQTAASGSQSTHQDTEASGPQPPADKLGTSEGPQVGRATEATAEGAHEESQPQGDTARETPGEQPPASTQKHTGGSLAGANPPSKASTSSLGGESTDGAEALPRNSRVAGKAFREAKSLLGRAEKSASAGKYGQAYRQAISAWEQLFPHRNNDPECQRLAESLLVRLKQYGEAANNQADKAVSQERPLLTR